MAGVLVGWNLAVARSKLGRSKYRPRAGRVLARSSIRGDATPSASPGGSARAFWDPVNTKSRPHASVSTGKPAIEVTASTRRKTSSNSRRSEEHTSELQSPDHLVCRLLLEKKKKKKRNIEKNPNAQPGNS